MGARRNRWEFRDIPYRPPRQVHDERGDASLKRGDSLFEHVLGGICKSAVDVARVGEAEASRGVRTVMEYVRSSLIYRHRSGVGRRVRVFLSYMELKRFKSVFVHNNTSFRLDSFCGCGKNTSAHSTVSEISSDKGFKIILHDRSFLCSLFSFFYCGT